MEKDTIVKFILNIISIGSYKQDLVPCSLYLLQLSKRTPDFWTFSVNFFQSTMLLLIFEQFFKIIFYLNLLKPPEIFRIPTLELTNNEIRKVLKKISEFNILIILFIIKNIKIEGTAYFLPKLSSTIRT